MEDEGISTCMINATKNCETRTLSKVINVLITLEVAFKPTSSIAKEQDSVDLSEKENVNREKQEQVEIQENRVKLFRSQLQKHRYSKQEKL